MRHYETCALGARWNVKSCQTADGQRRLACSLAALLLLTALTGCGPEPQSNGVSTGSVPVSLSISMPHESAAASTSGNRFWTWVQSWLLAPTNAWAVTYDLSDLTVTVTDSAQQLLSTKTENISSSHNSGDSISIDLDVPVGPDRIFAVIGIDRISRRPILQGKSRPVALIAGQAATVDITLADLNQPTISDPASLPVGVIGTPYAAQLTATGGTPPYGWTVTPPLPTGLILASPGTTATISGTPQLGTTGSTTHIFTVTDSTSPTPRTGTRDYAVTIAPPGLTITTPSLPNGTVTQGYSATVTASGGIPPYTWSIIGNDPNPGPGLSLSTDDDATTGIITGTPTNAGSFTSTYRVQDSRGEVATKSLTLIVSTLAPPVAPAIAPDLIAADDSCPLVGPLDPNSCVPGTSREDNITNVNRPRFRIPQLAAGETPSLYVDGTKVLVSFDRVTNTIRPTTLLGDGLHVITSTVSNVGGESPQSPSLLVTIDTVPPIS